VKKINQLKKYNIFRIICINVFAVLMLFFFKHKDSVGIRLEATYLVELILFFAFSYFFIAEIQSKFSRKMAVTSLKLALPVTLSAVFGIVINFSDKFFLEEIWFLQQHVILLSCHFLRKRYPDDFLRPFKMPGFLFSSKKKISRKNIIKTN